MSEARYKTHNVRRGGGRRGRLLLDGLSKLTRQLKTLDLPEGMTWERLSTLASLDQYDKVSVTALADLQSVRPATMSRMVSSLADDGLIRRLEDKEDGRGVLVAMTAKGRKAYRRATELSAAQLAAALQRLNQEQVDALYALANALESMQEGQPH